MSFVRAFLEQQFLGSIDLVNSKKMCDLMEKIRDKTFKQTSNFFCTIFHFISNAYMQFSVDCFTNLKEHSEFWHFALLLTRWHYHKMKSVFFFSVTDFACENLFFRRIYLPAESVISEPTSSFTMDKNVLKISKNLNFSKKNFISTEAPLSHHQSAIKMQK